ncbi:O-antigen export protein [Nibrella saemangeumensis]|uniref:O-antigen export protein n=1 Tax=Nibrella saemangeumensis TaxID=1084526 RepID=A0ABP8N0M5_9BACT
MNVRLFTGVNVSERTVNVLQNIYRSLLYKGASIIATLLLVPLSLQYLDKERYGIWITLSSLTAWLTFFDIGIGNGLRNRLTEALARNQLTEARKLVSTAYAVVGALMVTLWLIFLLASPFINWSWLVNASDLREAELSLVGTVVVSFFFAQLLLSLINPVLNAYQQNSKTGLIILAINVGSLLGVYTLTVATQSSFALFCVVQSLISLGSYLAFTWYCFTYTFPELRPALAYVDLTKLKAVMGLGLQFFIMQIAAVLLYQTNSILISRWFGPDEVTDYTVSFRYFNVITMGFSIITAPFWSSFTEAYTRQDYSWIRAAIRRSVQLWGVLQLALVVMVLNADWVYKAWTGTITDIPLSLSIANAVYVSLYAWNNIFITFLNGTGKIRLQFLVTLFVLILFFPLTYGLAVVAGIGVEGIVWGNCLCLALFSIQAPLQYLKLMNAKAGGLWSR